jgi:hypothetical protein
MGWSPSDRLRVVAAMAVWARRYGCGPSQPEWDAANDGTLPCARTIRCRWGWAAVVREALDGTGAEPSGHWWTRQEMLDALIAARERDGAWPVPSSWERATEEHPARRTYLRRFGSWEAAIKEAEAQAGMRSRVGPGN